ncbi:MAG: hypothetical protein FWC47_14935 [Oscillospiraceae bacterium]|nr:hypothetical protein [Oscillospiraceae bacterium]
MNQNLISALAISLILTEVFEIGFFFLIGKRNKKDMMLLVLVNVLTNPAVVLIYWMVFLYTDWNTVVTKILLEVSVVLIEGYYYKKFGQDFKHPFIFSAAANGFSYGMGVLLNNLLGGLL